MVVRNGHVVAEGWWAPYRADRKHTLYSLSKSITATAVGLAVGERRLTVEDTVVSFFPDDVPANADPKLARMKVKHLLTMATTDPNSVPNSGTGDGQNDAAQTDLRTVESTTVVYASPNPNQTPLPTVIPNQPAPEPGKADLSLQLQSSRRVGRVGEPVTFSLTVSNRGGATATTATVGISLPAGLTFVSSASGLVVNSGTLQGTVTNLAVGGSVTLTFVASATTAGNLIVTAQVLTASPTDSDSEPGNGYTNGEDDTAQVDIRVTQ